MSRYYLKFSKEGYIRYISHLDMLRLFKRSFKRAEIKLKYSQGFNPHPIMSFAQPLSLGYSSSGEYLEFETVETYNTDELVEQLNALLPEGVSILACIELDEKGKTLAALTESADYELLIPIERAEIDLPQAITEYLAQKTILIKKTNKKSGKEAEIDIRPLITNLSGQLINKGILLKATLAAGSQSNLSPELLLSSFCEFIEFNGMREEISVKRTEIHFRD